MRRRIRRGHDAWRIFDARNLEPIPNNFFTQHSRFGIYGNVPVAHISVITVCNFRTNVWIPHGRCDEAVARITIGYLFTDGSAERLGIRQLSDGREAVIAPLGIFDQ